MICTFYPLKAHIHPQKILTLSVDLIDLITCSIVIFGIYQYHSVWASVLCSPPLYYSSQLFDLFSTAMLCFLF